MSTVKTGGALPAFGGDALQTQGSKFETQSKQMLLRCKDYYLSRSYGEQGRYPT